MNNHLQITLLYIAISGRNITVFGSYQVFMKGFKCDVSQQLFHFKAPETEKNSIE